MTSRRASGSESGSLAGVAGLLAGGLLVSLSIYTVRIAEHLTEDAALKSAQAHAEAVEWLSQRYSESEALQDPPPSAETACPASVAEALRAGHSFASEEVSVSQLPIQWPPGEQPDLDTFQTEALRAFSADPRRELVRIERRPDARWLRYSRAQIVSASCVACHSLRAAGPQRDWREGDAARVIEVTRRIESLVSVSADLSGLLLLPLVCGGLTALGIGVAVARARARAREAEIVSKALAGTNRELMEQRAEQLKQQRALVKLAELADEQNAQLVTAIQETERARSTEAARVAELERARSATLNLLEDMQHARHNAEAADRAKSAFLANMSHEIRTPMNAILGFADLLDDPNLPERDRRRYLDTVRRNGAQLVGLINDILDLSKLDAGALCTEQVPCNVVQALEDIAELFTASVVAKGVRLEFVRGSSLPRYLSCDVVRVRQILTNLIGNAVKFTSQGTVTVEADFDAGRGSANGRLQVAVRDTGVGIPEDQLEEIFEPFAQADGSTTRRFGGTGLGLTICRRLARRLGGDILVQSSPGIGSCFTLTLDAHPVSETEVRQEQQPTAPIASDSTASAQTLGVRLHVLIVDDAPDNRWLMTAMLEGRGCRVSTASDGIEGLRAALDANRDDAPFDLILMDMQMPRLDGYGAVRELRSQGYSAPICALTAHSMAGDRERCLESGCDDYLTKPIDRERLDRILALLAEKRSVAR